MSPKPNAARANADRAAAMLSRAMAEPEPQAETVEAVAPVEPTSAEAAPVKRPPGRPKGKREVAARHTLNLDPARLDALRRLADDRNRSVHSLIIEGIDHVIGKPQKPGWTA